MTASIRTRTKHSVVAMIAGVALNAVAVLLVARWLGPSARGEMVKLTLIPTALNVVAGAGLPVSNVYLVAQGSLRPGVAAANSALWSMLVAVVLSAFVALTPVGAWVASAMGIGTAGLLLAVATSALLIAYQQLNAVHQGLGDFRTIRDGRIVQGVSLLVGVTVLATFGRLSPVTGYSVWIASFGLGAAWYAATGLTRFGAWRVSARELASSLRRGVHGMWSQIWDMVNFRGDQYLIAIIAAPAVLGVYSVAVAVSELIFHVPNAISQVVFWETSGAGPDAAANAPKTAGAVLVAAGLAALVMVPVAAVLVRFLGPGYAALPWVVALLAPATAVLAASRLVGALAMGRGHLAVPGWGAAISLAVTCGVDLLLVPRFGALGAAVGASTGYLVGAVVLVVATQRVTGIRILGGMKGGVAYALHRPRALWATR